MCMFYDYIQSGCVSLRMDIHTAIEVNMDEPIENGEQVEEPRQLAKMEISDESETPGAALNRMVRATEYLAVRHAMPKTNISNVILYENTSQERHLVRQLSSLTIRRERQKNVLDLQRRAFVQKQTRKHKKWKREDEFSLNNMNLPMFSKKEESRPNSMSIMYRNPDYELKSSNTEQSSNTNKSLPPLVEVKREKTEIVFHKDKTFITKVPSSFSLNQKTLKHHLGYCGKKYLIKGTAAQDKRFRQLDYALAPNKLAEHTETKTQRQKRLSGSSKSSRSSRKPFKRRMSSAQVIVPMKRGSTMADRKSFGSFESKSLTKIERANTDFALPTNSGSLEKKRVIEQFKTGDIRQLSKTLYTAE